MMTRERLLLSLFLGVAAYPGRSQPLIEAEPHDQTNIVGTTAMFSIMATSAVPSSLTYQWAFGSPPVNLSNGNDATLVLTNVQASNQGPYQVVVTDFSGSITSSPANLYVLAAPSLQFRTLSASAAESGGSVELAVLRTGWVAPAVTVDFTTVDGTASNGVNYSAVSGTMVFASGEIIHTITVPLLDEGLSDRSTFFSVALSNPSGGAVLGNLSRETITINTDHDSGFQFQFAAGSVSEDAGQVILRVVRDDDAVTPPTVDFSTSDLSAYSGLDYSGVTNTLSFGPQERVKEVLVPIINNSIKQPNRIFRAALANPVGASLGSQKTMSITIVDNDQGFQFKTNAYSVAQDAGVARLEILRGTDDTNSEVSVDISTSDGTALNGVDYEASTNTLVFAPGERVKQVGIRLLNNGVRNPTRGFGAFLSNPTGGAVLGSPATVTIQILNRDTGVSFEAASYTNSWFSGSNLTVTVLRGNAAALGPITVDYATIDATAVAGVDYQRTSGTLYFQKDETIKSLVIQLLRPRAVSGAKAFRVILMNPTGGATLGLSLTRANIEGAYATVSPLFDTALTIQQIEGLNLVSWSGGGLLQSADSPIGPWQSLTNATSPYAVQSPTPAVFYRVTRPRPANVYVPSGYDARTNVPLVILLHGYTWSGTQQENWMQFQPLAESRGFLYCYPDSAIDPAGNEFWNGTDACCDFWSTGGNDSGFLRALIEEIEARFTVDTKRVYLIGHSNGGYLSYHTACESADLIAAIASVAGSTFLDPNACHPSQPVNILQIHGTSDEYQFYPGGANNAVVGFPGNLPPFPSAPQSVRTWADYNGASSPVTDPLPTLDLTTDVAGLDTVITRYTNAPPGGAVELWTILGGTHWPNLTTQFAPNVIDWLFAHPKP